MLRRPDWDSMRPSSGDAQRETPHEQPVEVFLLLAEGWDGAKKTVMHDGQREEIAVNRMFPKSGAIRSTLLHCRTRSTGTLIPFAASRAAPTKRPG